MQNTATAQPYANNTAVQSHINSIVSGGEDEERNIEKERRRERGREGDGEGDEGPCQWSCRRLEREGERETERKGERVGDPVGGEDEHRHIQRGEREIKGDGKKERREREGERVGKRKEWEREGERKKCGLSAFSHTLPSLPPLSPSLPLCSILYHVSSLLY